MSSGPQMDSGTGGSVELAETFVTGDGGIKVAKLVSTLMGSLWLVTAAGWISIANAIAQVHIAILEAFAGYYTSAVRTLGLGGARVARANWGAAAESAFELDPLLAPLVLTLELIVVSGLVLWTAERWTP